MVRTGNTIQHEGKLYQIDPSCYRKEGNPKKTVVEERLDGKMVLMDGDREFQPKADPPPADKSDGGIINPKTLKQDISNLA